MTDLILTDDLRSAIIAATREVGDTAHQQWRALCAGGSIDQWHKADSSPVSEVDLAADRRLKTLLSAILPEAGWLSEETADDVARLGCRTIWCVDPIDGTRDFLRGRDGWAVSVALVADGAPLFGLLYAPARGQMWRAEAGGGAYCNDLPVSAGSREALAGARVPAHDLPKIDSDLAKVSQPNSIALRMAMVANDEADLVATLRWGFEWDVAAAALIAMEAGAVVTDALGGPLAFNTPRAQAFGVIACVPGIHGHAVERLRERAHAILG